MKMNKAISRIISITVCLVLCFGTLITAAATAKAKAEISLSSKKYSAADKKYVVASDFDITNSDEQTVYIPVSVNTASTVGGFGFTLSYDKEILEFSEGSSFLSVSDDNSSLSTHTVDEGITVLWETIADDICSSGEFYYAAFKIKSGLTENKTTAVGITVKQIYDGTDKQVNIIQNVTVKSVDINIRVNLLTEEELTPFRALETIVYPDSSADIKTANEAFSALSSAKQEQLKSNYPELYNYYATAQSRYNRLAEEASEKAVKNELAAYIDKHSAVWKLTADTVTLNDKEKVITANTEKDSLSSRALELLDKKYKTLLAELLSAIEAIEEANTEAAEYKVSYGYLANLTEKDIAADYTSYIVMLDEALLVYDMLGDSAKQIVSPLAEALKNLQAIAQKYLEADEAAKATAEKVNAFQKKWLDVFLINSGNVTLGDETAIELMLKDYNSLDEDAKKALSSRINTFKNLLTVIEGMKTADSEQSSTIVQVPGTNTTTTVTETKTVVEEKTNTIDKLIYLTKSNKWFFIILLILLIISLISFLLPFILRVWQSKRNDEDEEDAIEEITIQEETE